MYVSKTAILNADNLTEEERQKILSRLPVYIQKVSNIDRRKTRTMGPGARAQHVRGDMEADAQAAPSTSCGPMLSVQQVNVGERINAVNGPEAPDMNDDPNSIPTVSDSGSQPARVAISSNEWLFLTRESLEQPQAAET